MKIYFVVAELFYADEQTDMKRIVAFRSFAKEPKISPLCLLLSVLCLHCCNSSHANCLQSSIAAALQYEANTDHLMREIVCLVTGRNASVKCLAGNCERYVQFHILAFLRI